jgi:hypothetical protein
MTRWPGLVEEVVAAEAGVALTALRVEDPELRPPARRTVPVAGDGHLRPLADDVAPEPDPRSPGELEPDTRRFGHRGRQAGSQTRRLERDEERFGAASEGGETAQPIGDAGGGRTVVRSGRQVDDEEIDGPTGEQGCGDRQALIDRVGGQDDEPVEPDAAGNRLDRVEGTGQIEPGDDRPVDLGLRREPEGEGCLAGARVAAERDARAAGQTARPEDRVERREPGSDDSLHAPAAGRYPGEDRCRLLRRKRRHRQGPNNPRRFGTARSGDPRSCRTPACQEGRQSSRHIRGERRHCSTIEQMF